MTGRSAPVSLAAAVVASVLGTASLFASPRALHGQQSVGSATAGDGAGAVLSPDTVRVGERFTLGLSVQFAGDTVVFPALLPLGEEVEQLGPVRLRHERGRGLWRAYYGLVAWSSGTVSLPAVEVTRGEEILEVHPPTLAVLSVLPADPPAPLRLRPPRPPQEVWSFPWWLLLAVLAALVLAAWLARRAARRRAEALAALEQPPDAALVAREALGRLRAGVAEGRIAPEEFYDRLEETLRAYLHARRGWPVERPVRDLEMAARPPDETLLGFQARAGLVRFARVSGGLAVAVRDADACLAWLEVSEEIEKAEEVAR